MGNEIRIQVKCDAVETVDGMRVIFVPLWRWLLQEGSDLRYQGQ